MARRSRAQSQSPNKVLVIFLVIFILVGIGGFVWAYTLKKEQDKWSGAAEQKTKELVTANQAKDWYQFQRDELMAAVGAPQFIARPEAVKNWKDNRASFTKGDGKYRGEEGEEDFRAVIKSLEESLAGFNDGYKHRFGERQKQLESELAEAKEKHATKVLELSAKAQEFSALEKKYNDGRDALMKSIKGGSDQIIAARKETTETMTVAIRQNEELRKQIKDKEEEFAKLMTQKDQEIRNYKQAAQIKSQDLADKDSNRVTTGEPHSLLLDISTGKPLWDVPRGKIVRVEEGGRTLVINKGAKDGVKPGLTFNVFSAGQNGQAQGKLKATVEVVRVENADTSICKFNTYFDPLGQEIAAAEATPAQLFRDGGQAIKDGDLLFNTAWGAHVVIAGIVHWNGGDQRTPASQMDAIKEYIRQIERLGVVVDAYIDPRDGKVVGAVTGKTNFLIRGLPTTVLQDGVDEKRAGAVNAQMKVLRDLAVDSGLFIVSVDNFAMLTGQRRLANSGGAAAIGFVPSPPAGLLPPDAQKKDQERN